jgi:hypothetical protein
VVQEDWAFAGRNKKTLEQTRARWNKHHRFSKETFYRIFDFLCSYLKMYLGKLVWLAHSER